MRPLGRLVPSDRDLIKHFFANLSFWRFHDYLIMELNHLGLIYLIGVGIAAQFSLKI